MAQDLYLALISGAADLAVLSPFLQMAQVAFKVQLYRSLQEFAAANIETAIILFYDAQSIPDYQLGLDKLHSKYPNTAFLLLTKNYDEALAKAFIKETAGHYLSELQWGLLPTILDKLSVGFLTAKKREEIVEKQQNVSVFGYSCSEGILSAWNGHNKRWCLSGRNP